MTVFFRHEAVESTCINSAGFLLTSANCGEMDVEFHSGAIYRYYDVPQKKYERFMAAKSKGAFLNYAIKGEYVSVKLKDRKSSVTFKSLTKIADEKLAIVQEIANRYDSIMHEGRNAVKDWFDAELSLAEYTAKYPEIE